MSYYPHFTDGETNLSKLFDLPRTKEQKDSNPDLSNRKTWALAPPDSQSPARGLPAIPPPQLAQNMGCRPYPSSFYAVSWALAVPLAHRVSVLAQHSFPAMWPHTRLLALRQGWGCHGDALPQACLAGPTSHWNVSEIPPFRPASKPPLPRRPLSSGATGKSFQILPWLSVWKTDGYHCEAPIRLLFPLSLPYYPLFSLPNIMWWLQAQTERQSLSSNFSSSTSQTFDLGLILGA